MLNRVAVLTAGLMIAGCAHQFGGNSSSVDLADQGAVGKTLNLRLARQLHDTFAAPDMAAADIKLALQHAMQSDHAVVFVHVDWAFMTDLRQRYWDFVVAYARSSGGPYTAFHYTDCTDISHDYSLLRDIPGYKSLEDPKGGSLHGGVGELMWIDRGRVVGVEPIIYTPSTEALVAKTLDFWSAER